MIIEALYGKLPLSQFSRNYDPSSMSKHSVLERKRSSDMGALDQDSSLQYPETLASDMEIEWIDVTIYVQALVYSSQIYISGGHSKVVNSVLSCVSNNSLFLVPHSVSMTHGLARTTR